MSWCHSILCIFFIINVCYGLNEGIQNDLSKAVGEKSKEYCTKYSQSLWQLKKIHWSAPPMNISTCARAPSKPLVIDGEKALAKEFPHQAALGYEKDGKIIWENGGSLISEQFVLTAAHCIKTSNGEIKWVRLGDLNINETTDDADPKEFRVTIIPHPDYAAPKVYNDIALLKMEKPVEFNEYIGPICLQTAFEMPGVNRYLATGWGVTEYAGDLSPDLMKVIVDKFDYAKCNESFTKRRFSKRKLNIGIVQESMVCAGSISSSKDTCQGDSGGPLQIYNPDAECTYKIIGITSFGATCGVERLPGIYTRVSHYIKWIEDNVWP